MSRVIKFRGKFSDSHSWVYGYYYNNCEVGVNQDIIVYHDHEAGDSVHSVINSKYLGQYTGLLDKNGKEIFEGDILKRVGRNDIFQGSADDIPGANPINIKIEVVEIKVTNTCFGFSLSPERTYSERGNPATYEIIGNIYENPDLLKK